MKQVFIGLLGLICALALVVGMTFGSGYLDAAYKRTAGKAIQNAEREVFEETQSFVEGKRQEAAKLYREYQLAETQDEKDAIKTVVAHSFANFDENKLQGKIKLFIYNCKYNP